MAIDEIFAYQQKAALAENELIAVVKADTLPWVQHEFGWWYRYIHRSDEHIEYSLCPPPKDLQGIIRETVYNLQGDRLMVDAIREFDNLETSTSANCEEPIAYQLMLKELVPTDTVMMLIPWMLAYGQSGNAYVPPFTNIRVQLTWHTAPYDDVELLNDTTAIKTL